MAATIKDVASEAGVSVSTVSTVINRSKRCSPDVEARVRAAIERTGYRPNPMARGMITGRTHAIGLVILDITNPHYAALVKGASREAARRGYTVLLADAEESPEREQELIQTLALRVDGLVLAGSRLPDAAIVELAAGPKPIVSAGRAPGPTVPSANSNIRESAYVIARHLVETGHERIAYLRGPPFMVDAERWRGIREALERSSLEPLEWRLPSPDAAGGEAVAAGVLFGPVRPDAVIAYNDMAAIGFLRAAKTLGVRVPDELSVAGFDNVPLSDQISPSLTTTDGRSVDVGHHAVALLLDRLEGRPGPDQPVVLASSLIVRDSTRPRR